MSSERVIDLRKKRGAQRRAAPQQAFAFGAPQGRTPLRIRRRRVRLAVVAAILAALALLVFAVRYVSYLPQLNVQTVRVSGTQELDPQAVEQYVLQDLDSRHGFLSMRGIFLYPRTQIENDLISNFPRIRFVGISRRSLFATEIDVKVDERSQYALWCSSATLGTSTLSDLLDCYKMDDGGYLFAAADVASTSPSGQYIFRGGLTGSSTSPVGKIFAQGHLPGLVALLTQLGQAGFDPTGVSIEEDPDFSVPLGQGYYIKASYGQDAAALARNLQLVLGSDALKAKDAEIEYIDLRFGNRVYYKLKGEEQTQAQ